ncbi:hypothetical protein GCM10010236_44590 [Streptomyces eurythermus]|nr:hypothetical protein GCM10010236_44590 [Streptomyces eurythermus]
MEWESFAVRIGDLDAEAAGRGHAGEGDPEVTALDATVEDGVGRELGGDLCRPFGHAW